jgi:putative hydrolase
VTTLAICAVREASSTLDEMTPVEALERVVHCLDRAHDTGFKTKAFVRALEVVRATPPDELEARAAAGTLTDLDGIGDSTARLITETLHGDTSYVDKIEAETGVTLTDEGARYRAALKGDCHMHSRWSDGGATIEAMARTARDLGHDYMVLTDHSPRLTVAHGLSKERLDQQLADVAVLNEKMAPFRILTGIEVDILEDGTLDHTDDVLSQLDVVVASVHSKLRMERQPMTERMVRAVASPHVDILGHCTGRMIGKRDPSTFDADYVFAACAQFHTAVEINCRPERLDPPRPLLELAVQYGCYFSIDSDAHATGQLEWQPLGCNRAAECEVPLERVINTWAVDDLLRWVQAA